MSISQGLQFEVGGTQVGGIVWWWSWFHSVIFCSFILGVYAMLCNATAAATDDDYSSIL